MDAERLSAESPAVTGPSDFWRRFLTLRRSLFSVLVFATLVFVGTLVWAIATYSSFTIKTYQEAQAKVLLALTKQKLGTDFERPTLELARLVAGLPRLHEGVALGDPSQVAAALSDGFRQSLVTGGLVDLRQLVALDAAMKPLEALPAAPPSPAVAAFIDALAERTGAARKQIATRYLIDGSGAPLYLLVHPIGTFRPIGYLVVAASPVAALSGLAATLSAEVKVANPSGDTLLDDGPIAAAPGAASDAVSTWFRSAEGLPLLRLTLISDNAAFHDEARRVSRIGYIAVGIATMVALLAGLVMVRLVVVRRIAGMTEALRGIARGDTAVAIPPPGPDEIGGMAHDLERVVGYVRDAVDLKERVAAKNAALEREIAERRRAEASAQLATRAKSEFLANISHELRTPLNAIIGFSEIMERAMMGPLDPRYRDYSREIRLSGDHLLAVINDVLDITKIEAGKLELKEDFVNLPALILASARLLASRAESGGVEVATEAAADLPLLHADPVRVKQIVLNLLSNAVKFTPSGGTVELRARRAENGGIELLIADTGIGMNAEEIAIALEPFRQVDGSLSRRYEGTGLGLPIAKMIAELHGGTLAIASAPGSGTTVTVAFPRERTAVEAPQAAGAVA
jgi:signal transduction histidine kinase